MQKRTWVCPDRVSELIAYVRERPEWTEPYIAFLLRGELPVQEVIARQIKRRAKAYVVIDSELYKRSPTGVFQRCVSPEEGQKILREIHAGDCGHHASTRPLVAKAFRHGFFWLTALADAEYNVQRCDGCQRYARQAHVPAQELRTIHVLGLSQFGVLICGSLSNVPLQENTLVGCHRHVYKVG